MEHAPSVSYPVGRSPWAGALLAVWWLAALAATIAWTVQPQSGGWRLAFAWCTLAAAGVLAGAHWSRSARGVLAWDGAGWTWTGAGAAPAPGQLEVSVDLQRLLLVRWRGARAPRWLWLERASASDRWDDLRRAVYSRARHDALPGAQPPAAKP